jgi:hypothetical protein
LLAPLALRWPPAGDIEGDDVERLDPRLGLVAVYTEGSPAPALEPLRGHRAALEIDEPVLGDADGAAERSPGPTIRR